MALVKLNNRGVRSATTFGSISALGEMRFIKKQTASSSSTISFVDGTSDVVLDDTYKEYLFTFNNIHPETDNTKLEFDFSTDGGSNYSVTKTSTSWRGQHGEDDSSGVQQYDGALDLAQGTANQILGDSGNDNDLALSGYNETITSTTFAAQHGESGSPTELSYDGSADQAQGTAFQWLSAHNDVGGAEADESLSGYLHLFNPSNTTFVKHFIAVTQYSGWESRSVNSYTAGYFNTTSAIDEIQFKMTSGNIDAGDICLYGIN